MPCRARIFEIRSQSRDMPSDVTILYQPLGPRRTAALVHRATFTSNTREMLLRPIPENGTINPFTPPGNGLLAAPCDDGAPIVRASV